MTNKIFVSILKDSVSNTGRVTTFELCYPRFIHAEVLRHRVFSHSVESSRAKPVEKNIKEVMTNPVIPQYWTENQPGMVGKPIENQALIQVLSLSYKATAIGMAQIAQKFKEMNLHKQIINRLLEPYLMTHEILTGDDFDNFFKLRIADDAEPHIRQLAELMKEAMEKSEPEKLMVGEWHLPYIKKEDYKEIKQFLSCNNINKPLIESLKDISAARCARVSYKAFDGSIDYFKDLSLANKLKTNHHFSPFEHVCTPSSLPHKGNLKGWKQYRHELDI